MKFDWNILPFALLGIINSYWTWQGRKVQNDRDIIKSLQTQISLKDEAIEEMRQKKNELKMQYGHLLVAHKKLEGELQTYKTFHGHPQVD